MSHSKRAEEQRGIKQEAVLPGPGAKAANLRLQKLILPAVTFVVAMAGYLLTFARTVTLVDSGETRAKNSETISDTPSNFTQIFNWVMPVAVGLTFAFSITLWFYASVAEVYTLNIALFATVVYLMFRWQRIWGSKGKEKPREA